MPCLEITIPKTNEKTRKQLAEKLTAVFAETTGFPKDIFGVLFNEYKLKNAASGGLLCDSYEGRPYLHFLLYCPRLKRTIKQKVVEQFTKTYVDVIGKDDWLPIIHICEHPYDNVGVDGKLLSDSYEQCAQAKFYYEMKEE